LFDPNHVGEVGPGPGVFDGFKGAVLPQEGAVFLEKAFEGRAAWSALVWLLAVVGLGEWMGNFTFSQIVRSSVP